jgi:spermidine synthase
MPPAATGDVRAAPAQGRGRRAVALGLMGASGFAGLGYQIVWTRQAALWLGQEAAAVLAVVAAFFGGLALGAWVLGARIERSARPARWYAACELAIGTWGAVLLFALAPASAALLAAGGADPGPARQWAVAFGGTFLLLLPATAAMGATLPALAGWLAARERRGGALARLYAANTLGAVAGVLATAFWLLPEIGLRATAALCIALNFACAALAWRWPDESPPAPEPAPAQNPSLRRGVPPELALLAATGLLGIGYEVVVVRVLSQVFENTVYTFALVLAVYLVGTALGAAAWARVLGHRLAGPARRGTLLALLAAACGLGLASLWVAVPVRDVLAGWVGSWWSDRMAAALCAEAVVALLAFGPPTLLMGALFSQLAEEARAAGIGFGRALAWNTLGAAMAPLVLGVLALPQLGAQATLLALAAAYALLAWRGSWRRPWPWALAATAGAAAALAPALVIVDLPTGGRLVSHDEGATATVSVLEDARGVRSLHIDNRQQEGSSATRLADGRQALLPLLLHPAPRTALFLGVGTGVTAATAAGFPGVAIDAVELLPEVLATWSQFNPPDGPRPRLQAADARRYVRTAAQRYDVIVADNFHPARSGSGSLYTVEHFAAVRERIAPGGLFCQWLPLHQLDLATLRSIVRSFQVAFPEARAVLATNSLLTPVIGLVGHAGMPQRDPAALRAALHAAAQGAEDAVPAAFGYGDEMALLGSFVAGPGSLARFAGGAPLNTDDRPVVAHAAPRHTYAPASSPADRLLTLLSSLTVAPIDIVVPGTDPAFSARLAAYAGARHSFLQAGRAVSPSPDVRQMLAQVQAPLLAVLNESPDFEPAFTPLLQMARALGRVDPPAARRLLLNLRALRPGSAEVEHALRGLAQG